MPMSLCLILGVVMSVTQICHAQFPYSTAWGGAMGTGTTTTRSGTRYGSIGRSGGSNTGVNTGLNSALMRALLAMVLGDSFGSMGMGGGMGGSMGGAMGGSMGGAGRSSEWLMDDPMKADRLPVWNRLLSSRQGGYQSNPAYNVQPATSNYNQYQPYGVNSGYGQQSQGSLLFNMLYGSQHAQKPIDY